MPCCHAQNQRCAPTAILALALIVALAVSGCTGPEPEVLTEADIAELRGNCPDPELMNEVAVVAAGAGQRVTNTFFGTEAEFPAGWEQSADYGALRSEIFILRGAHGLTLTSLCPVAEFHDPASPDRSVSLWALQGEELSLPMHADFGLEFFVQDYLSYFEGEGYSVSVDSVPCRGENSACVAATVSKTAGGAGAEGADSDKTIQLHFFDNLNSQWVFAFEARGPDATTDEIFGSFETLMSTYAASAAAAPMPAKEREAAGVAFLVAEESEAAAVIAFQDDDGPDCPPHSTPVGDKCICYGGYVMTAGGTCITLAEACKIRCAGKSEHATGNMKGLRCVCACNAGYGFSETSGKCVSCASACKGIDPNAVYDSAGTGEGACSCKCKAGYGIRAEGGKCEPVAGAQCDAYCEEKRPHSHGVISGELCKCYCDDPYKYLPEKQACVSPDELTADTTGACAKHCMAYPNTDAIMEGEMCGCACKSGYYPNAAGSGCVTCRQWCRVPNAFGVDKGDQCVCECGPGYKPDWQGDLLKCDKKRRKAVIFVNRNLSAWEKANALPGKVSIRSFLKKQGYSPEDIITIEVGSGMYTEIANYLALNPEVDAMAYFGHGAEFTELEAAKAYYAELFRQFQEQGATDALTKAMEETRTRMAELLKTNAPNLEGAQGFMLVEAAKNALRTYYESRGLSPDEIEGIIQRRFHARDDTSFNLTYAYIHACFGFNDKTLADSLVAQGGTFWGKEGTLYVYHFLEEYVKPETSWRIFGTGGGGGGRALKSAE